MLWVQLLGLLFIFYLTLFDINSSANNTFKYFTSLQMLTQNSCQEQTKKGIRD
jgi:hypothetical protein